MVSPVSTEKEINEAFNSDLYNNNLKLMSYSEQNEINITIKK